MSGWIRAEELECGGRQRPSVHFYYITKKLSKWQKRRADVRLTPDYLFSDFLVMLKDREELKLPWPADQIRFDFDGTPWISYLPQLPRIPRSRDPSFRPPMLCSQSSILRSSTPPSMAPLPSSRNSSSASLVPLSKINQPYVIPRVIPTPYLPDPVRRLSLPPGVSWRTQETTPKLPNLELTKSRTPQRD